MSDKHESTLVQFLTRPTSALLLAIVGLSVGVAVLFKDLSNREVETANSTSLTARLKQLEESQTSLQAVTAELSEKNKTLEDSVSSLQARLKTAEDKLLVLQKKPASGSKRSSAK